MLLQRQVERQRFVIFQMYRGQVLLSLPMGVKITTQQLEQDHQQLMLYVRVPLVEIKQFQAELLQFNSQQLTLRTLY